MPDKEVSTGKLFSELPNQSKLLFGRTILTGLKDGTFTFINPLASEGGDYDQDGGSYNQTGGGNHDQGGSGDYNQAKLTGNLGHLDITDLAEILRTVEDVDQ